MIAYSLGIAATSSNEGVTAFEVTSTEEEKKTVDYLEYTDVTLEPIILTVWLEREKIVDAIPIEEVTLAMPPRRIELNVEVPIGETLTAKVTPQVSGAQGRMDGWVYYSIAK